MILIRRHTALALAALLTLLMTLAHYRGGLGGSPTPSPVSIVAPPKPAVVAVKTKKKARRLIVATRIDTPAELEKPRGIRLRDKGEAMGGGTPDRVDTGTMTVPASQ